MGCPSYIWRKAQAEGVSLAELGRRGALVRAKNRRLRAKAASQQLELPLQSSAPQQLELFPQRKPH